MNNSNRVRDFILLVLTVGVCLVWVSLRTQRAETATLRQKVEELTNQNRTVSLDLQEKCAVQAWKAFKIDGGGNDKNEPAGVRNHFNKKLGKCFVEVESFNLKTGAINKSLTDAFEGEEYGTFYKSDNNPSTVPFTCRVTSLTSGNDQECHSSDEYQDLIKQYLQY